MSTGEAIVIALRIAIPLLILRYPLAGGLAAMVIDALDVVLISAMHLGGFGDHYPELDKLLDSYYLTLELVVAFNWISPYARNPAIFLYAYRMIGVALFEVTHARALLLVFPNVFENWWLYVVIAARFFPSLYPRTWRSVAMPLVILLIPKMGQEYMLHYAEVQPWDWIKKNVIRTG